MFEKEFIIKNSFNEWGAHRESTGHFYNPRLSASIKDLNIQEESKEESKHEFNENH